MDIKRPVAFVLASTNHGTMIVNRNDHVHTQRGDFGVGYQLLNSSQFDPEEVNFACWLLSKRKQYFGPDVLAIDCGANIGVHTIEWAKLMTEWGRVISFEAQEKIFYALAGNIAINNCLNVTADNAAVGERGGFIDVPIPDYLKPGSFGSLEIREKPDNEFIGQNINYKHTKQTRMYSLDSLGLGRVDFVKIDVEGMEESVLRGATRLIKKNHPIMLIEFIKSDRKALEEFLTKNDYEVIKVNINILAIHKSDPTLKDIEVSGDTIKLRK